KRAEMLLDELRIMVGHAEQMLAAPVAAAEARAVNRCIRQLFLGAGEQRQEIFRGSSGIVPLKLDRLALAWKRSNCNRARLRIGAEEIAHEKIAAVKFLQVFVDDQANEQIAARFFLFLGGQRVEGFSQNFIGRAVSD